VLEIIDWTPRPEAMIIGLDAAPEPQVAPAAPAVPPPAPAPQASGDAF